nr:hypothetical protein [Lonsdalea iberica]
MAAGDLSQPLPLNDRTAREVHPLSLSITLMQFERVTLVDQVRGGMKTMLAHVAQANDDNQKLSIQAEYQFKELSAATEHVEELNQHLENHERQTCRRDEPYRGERRKNDGRRQGCHARNIRTQSANDRCHSPDR